FLIYRFDLNHQDLGTFFLYTGLWLIFGQLVTVRLVANKLPEEKLVYLSVFGAAGVMLLYLVPTNWYGLMFVLPFFTNFMAISMANIPALVSKVATSDRQGEYMGINNSVQAVALTIAPILSGYISAQLTPVSIIITAASLMACAALIFAFYASLKKSQYY
ncbi:MAG TPA: MFS transporter, partial [Patescibacteria group bacterium]